MDAALAPRCGEALTVLNAVDIIETLLKRPLEVWALSLGPTPFPLQRPFAALKNGDSREGGGFASRSRVAVQVHAAGAPPYPDHVLV